MKHIGKLPFITSMVLAGVCLGIPANSQAASQINVTESAQYPVNPADTEADNANLQRILNQAKDAVEELTFYFPAGTYYVTQPLRIYSNTHIILDDNATICRQGDGVDRSILHNVDANGAMDQVGGYDMSHDIIIEGGTWDGGDISEATDAADIVRFDHAQNITVRNCRFKNVYDCHHLELVGIKNGLVEGCTFRDFHYRSGQENNYVYAREAVQIETAWTNTESDPEEDAWADGSVIDGTSCESVTVTGCTFDNIPCGVGQHHFTQSGEHRNLDIEISNNTLTYDSSANNGKTAITCCGINGLKVSGNTIIGGYRFAIHIDAADDVSVQSNQIQDIQMNGIMIDGGQVSDINENTISNITKHGISCGGGTVSSISDNKISNVGQNGICVDDGIVNMISANTIKTVKKSGISIVGGTVGSGTKKTAGIIKNTIQACKLNGITVSKKCKVSSIARNQITNVNNNGISLTDKAKVTWVIKNKYKKCKKHDLWNGLKTKVKIQK